jgi:hypothetical protein
MGEAALKLETIYPPEETRTITLLDLVAAISDSAESEAEVIATVRQLVNSGRVRLIGSFRGADVRVA